MLTCNGLQPGYLRDGINDGSFHDIVHAIVRHLEGLILAHRGEFYHTAPFGLLCLGTESGGIAELFPTAKHRYCPLRSVNRRHPPSNKQQSQPGQSLQACEVRRAVHAKHEGHALY